MVFTATDMQRLVSPKPFVAFRIYLSDGGQIDVISPELVLVGRRVAVVGILDADAKNTFFDRWTTIWYMHITRVEYLQPGEPPIGPSSPPTSPGSPSPATA